MDFLVYYPNPCFICNGPTLITDQINLLPETLQATLSFISGLETFEENDLICDSCMNDLQVIFNFRSKCLNSVALLNRLLGVQGIIEEELGGGVEEASAEVPIAQEEVVIDQEPIVAPSPRTTKRIKESGVATIKLPRKTEFQCAKCSRYYSSKASLYSHYKVKHRIVIKTVPQILREKGPAPSVSPEKKSKAVIAIRDERQWQPRNKAPDDIYHGIDLNVTCQYCFAEFASREENREHQRVQHQAEEFKFRCRFENCTSIFKARSSLRKHYLGHTASGGGFTCTECGRKYSLQMSLKLHYEQQHVKGRSHQCDQCGQAFYGVTDLKRHIMRHQNIKPHKCTYEGCSKAYLTTTQRTLHIKYAHTKVKNFSCDECSKKFVTLGNLQDHKVTHTQERKFVCPKCGNAFSRKKVLDVHLKYHEVQRDFPCPQCHLTFITTTARKKHMLVHDSTRSFPCPLCSSFFLNRSSVQRHVTLVHKNKGRSEAKVEAKRAAVAPPESVTEEEIDVKEESSDEAEDSE